MSDYIFLLESRLNRDQLQLLVQVQQAAASGNLHVFLTGGAVRDLLGGFAIRDLDFSIEGPALKLVRQLDKRLFTVVSVDELRHSAEVVFGGAATAEIAICRRESYPKPGAKPEVRPATIQDDLRRRDLSINSMAISLNPASRGLLLDPTNGLADLERKELRATYPSSFFDDPSRLLRIVRLQARLKYTIEEKTQRQMESAREAGVEHHIPPRTLLRELRQLASETELAEPVRALASAGLLGLFEPHLPKKLDWGLLGRLEKAKQAVEQAGTRVDAFAPFLWALTKKLTPAERAVLRSRVGWKAGEAKPWMQLEARARRLQKTLLGKQMAQNSRLYEALSAEDPAVALFLMAFSPAQTVRERVKHYFTQLRPLAAAVRDEEVEKLGVRRGTPKFGEARAAYVASRLDRRTADQDEARKPSG